MFELKTCTMAYEFSKCHSARLISQILPSKLPSWHYIQHSHKSSYTSNNAQRQQFAPISPPQLFFSFFVLPVFFLFFSFCFSFPFPFLFPLFSFSFFSSSSWPDPSPSLGFLFIAWPFWLVEPPSLALRKPSPPTTGLALGSTALLFLLFLFLFALFVFLFVLFVLCLLVSPFHLHPLSSSSSLSSFRYVFPFPFPCASSFSSPPVRFLFPLLFFGSPSLHSNLPPLINAFLPFPSPLFLFFPSALSLFLPFPFPTFVHFPCPLTFIDFLFLFVFFPFL